MTPKAPIQLCPAQASNHSSTALDIVGGYESLVRIPGMQVEFVAKVGRKMAEIIQMGIEYYPATPFGPATVDEASPEAIATIVRLEKNAEAHLVKQKRIF